MEPTFREYTNGAGKTSYVYGDGTRAVEYAPYVPVIVLHYSAGQQPNPDDSFWGVPRECLLIDNPCVSDMGFQLAHDVNPFNIEDSLRRIWQDRFGQ